MQTEFANWQRRLKIGSERQLTTLRGAEIRFRPTAKQARGAHV